MNTLLHADPSVLRRVRVDPLAFCGVLTLLLIGIPFLAFRLLDWDDITIEIAVSVGILVFSATRLAWLAGVGRPRLLIMTFYIFIYVWIGIAATAQLVADTFPIEKRVHLEEDVLPSLMIVV